MKPKMTTYLKVSRGQSRSMTASASAKSTDIAKQSMAMSRSTTRSQLDPTAISIPRIQLRTRLGSRPGMIATGANSTEIANPTKMLTLEQSASILLICHPMSKGLSKFQNCQADRSLPNQYLNDKTITLYLLFPPQC